MDRWKLILAFVVFIHVQDIHGQCGKRIRHYDYGDNCEYQCHCVNEDDRCGQNAIPGECSSGCKAGWMGPGCQFRNIAKGKVSDANFLTSQTEATDGVPSTCTSQSALTDDPFIRVTIGFEIVVSHVTITFKNYTAAAGFRLYTGQTTLRDQSTLCRQDPENDVIDNRLTLACVRSMKTRFITIQLPGVSKSLELCEIEVSVGRNLAYLKPTSQLNTERESSFAVNGIPDDFSATRETDNPYWQLDLGAEFNIDMIEIGNRLEYDGGYFLVGFTVHISNHSDFGEAELLYTDYSTKDTISSYIPIPLFYKVARYVRISIPYPLRRLHLREVWVLGGCVNDVCGLDCNQMCHCANDDKSPEEQIFGTCNGPCDRNWRDVSGYCNTSICTNSFGYECRYGCNCEDMCEPWQGTCLVQESTCKTHYYGKQCQGYNIVNGSPFTAQGINSNFKDANLTVDGDINTCAAELIGDGSSWVVPLGSTRLVDQVLVYVNDNNTGYGFEIVIEDANNIRPCDTSSYGNSGQFLGNCRHQAATHLRIRTRSSMQLCEVVLLDCADGTFGDLCQNLCLCADGAPCNKLTGVCPGGGCESGYRGVRCDQECARGTFGNNCSSECGQCALGDTCDIFSGLCPGQCQAGWYGGRCDSECRNGTYGVGCQMKCGYCMDEEPCNKATGVCIEGCNPGYRTANCTVECPAGEYGYNCNSTCGDCSGGEICDKRDGICRNGCELGMQPPLCQTVCIHGTFGKDCINTCGDCRYNNTCNPATGVCEDGCDPGVYVRPPSSPLCNQECVDGNYGYDCTQQCVEDVCLGGNNCNKTNGGCLRGCLNPGYQAPLCLTECCDGTYGTGCSMKCGMCEGRSPCNKTTGMCPGKCEGGYSGDKCDEFGALSSASIAMLVIGLLLALIGLAAIGLAYWFVRRGGKPLLPFKRKNDMGNKEEKMRNPSLVSRIYENNIAMETDIPVNNKDRNSDSYLAPQTREKGTVQVENLWDYVVDKIGTKTDLIKQFKELPIGLMHPSEAAKKAQNLRKNRYKEIFAYDHSRVKLDILAGDAGNDYINACFISGYNRPHMYIAAQGPTDELVHDFWRMVWQKKCRKIVMLTRLVEGNKVKCSQYWPDEGNKQYGSVNVEYREIETFADFDVRTFDICSISGTETREVKQFHYTAWPDRHVPDYASSVVHFWSKVRATDNKDNVPILVHCSAGIGRTGTFLALDFLVDQARTEGYVNVLQCAQNLRHERVNMIQNQEQYDFIHEALNEAIVCPSTVISCEQFPKVYKALLETDSKTRKTKLAVEFEKLQHVTKFNDSMKSHFYENIEYKSSRSTVNMEKNRNNKILPNDMHRPWLTSRVRERNDYINAVYLPSNREDRMFLITQDPLPDTIVDFWRMIFENKVTSIVSLDRPQSPSEIYWPTEGETLTFIPFQLHNVSEVDHTTYVERTIKILNAEEPREKARLIKQYECKFWNGDRKLPTGHESSILEVHDQMMKWQQTTGIQPIAVHCLDGATKSGLFCVTSATLERLKLERDVAIQQTIKQMRIRRHQIVPTYDQYKFCHEVALESLKSFDMYSNSNFFI